MQRSRHPLIQNRLLTVSAMLIMISTAPAEDLLVWSFAEGLQGWQPGNWERTEVTPQGLRGTTKYDAQLLSPKLQINAGDYPVLLARLRTNLSGSGETFFCAPAGRMSDGTKARHTLQADEKFRLYRIDLRQSQGQWKGPIERIRFDPLNPAGAEVTIDFIALLPNADQLLVNGGGEIVAGGVPFEWECSGSAANTTVTRERPRTGTRAFRVGPGAAWQTHDLDMSFLGTLNVSGYARGSAPHPTLTFLDQDGRELGNHTIVVDGSSSWRRFASEADVPRRAYSARLRLRTAGKGVADFDDIHISRSAKGNIRRPPPEKPRWAAAWIWHPDCLDKDDQRVWFRHTFRLPPGKIRQAQIQISVDDAYALTVNEHEAIKTFGEADGWRTPEVLDITRWLRPGPNTVHVEALDVRSAQGLIAEIATTYEDASEIYVRTDANWEVSITPDGPWQRSKELGHHPCLPWGEGLLYEPLGRRPVLDLSLQSIPTHVLPGQALPLHITAVARTDVQRPVAIAATLTRDGVTHVRRWAPKMIFRDNPAEAGAGDDATWQITVPYGLAPGKLTLALEMLGADCKRPVSRLELDLAENAHVSEFPTAGIRMVSGVPVITVDGRDVDPTQNLFIHPDELQQGNGRDTEIAVWSVGLEEMGFYETGFDYSKVDSTIATYLSAKPDAWLLLTFTFDTRYQPWWIQKHPEARCRKEDGSDNIGDYHGSRRRVPAYASETWRDAYTTALRNLIQHLRQTPFAERIIGFHPCCGISWEWFHWGAQSGELVDYSEAGQRDFRRWLRERYGEDERLQVAWGRPDVTLVGATIPGEDRRRHAEQGIFFSPTTQRDVLDYNAYQHDIVADSILHFARVVKQETNGRSLFGTYYGYVSHLPETPGFCQGSGHFRLGRMLDSPDIDFLVAPVAYAWREVGGTAATMTVAGSFALHGKLFWNQADLRSHWSEQTGHGRPDTVRGSVACMRRELARNLAEGSAIQWYDFSKGWTFGDERLTDEARRLYHAGQSRTATHDWSADKYLLVVVDEEQMGTFDPFTPPFGLSLIYRQREYLARAGIPWRIVLFSDLMQVPDLLDYRAMLFLNLFSLSDEKMAFLQRKIMCDGRTVAFVGPVGIVGPRGVDAARTSELLGWDVARSDLPPPLNATFAAGLTGVWEQTAGLRVGISRPFPSVAVPTDVGNAQVLAVFTGTPSPAILFEERDGVKLFWSVAPGLEAGVLRALAETAGVPVVCRSNDAVYAGNGFIGVHARVTGQKSVQLPRASAVRELLNGKTWPAGTRTLTLDMRVGDTAILAMTKSPTQ